MRKVSSREQEKRPKTPATGRQQWAQAAGFPQSAKGKDHFLGGLGS